MKKYFLFFTLLVFINCFSQDNKNYFDLGKLEMKNQNFNEAIKNLSTAIAENQNRAEAYFARGLCYNLIKDYEKSTADFTSAENLGFKDIRLYTLRSFAFDQINDQNLALKDLNKALEIDPEFYPKNYYNRGALQVKLKNYRKALLDFNEYLKREKESIGYFERGKLLLYLGKKNEACEDLKTSFNLGNNTTEILKLTEKSCK
jgi:tetratricopeptide (TPR) repeat protein